MALLFVDFLLLNMLSKLVDCTSLALSLAFFDLPVNNLPSCCCAVFPEPPFLELALILSFAVSTSASCYRSKHRDMIQMATFERSCVVFPFES